MRAPQLLLLTLFACFATGAAAEPTLEWELHRTADGVHPDGQEQALVWLMNRARESPGAEGFWLATELHPDVSAGRGYFGVDTNVLEAEFFALDPTPPAAFDRRLYQAAEAHSLALIERDSQDHTGQRAAVDEAGFVSLGGRINVFSYAQSPLNAHAAFNIDWGPSDDGMQPARAHRRGVMGSFDNVGIAAVEETDPTTGVGRYVTSGNYFDADTSAVDHYDRFLVGTVWEDLDGNGTYDPGEGLGGVTVMPRTGPWFSVTAAGGGYALPIVEPGTYDVTFSGGDLPGTFTRYVSVGAVSARLDLEPIPEPGGAWLATIGLAILGPFAWAAERRRAA